MKKVYRLFQIKISPGGLKESSQLLLLRLREEQEQIQRRED